jgi:hypothetical protein
MVLKAIQKEKNFWPKLRKKTSLKIDWAYALKNLAPLNEPLNVF